MSVGLFQNSPELVIVAVQRREFVSNDLPHFASRGVSSSVRRRRVVAHRADVVDDDGVIQPGNECELLLTQPYSRLELVGHVSTRRSPVGVARRRIFSLKLQRSRHRRERQSRRFVLQPTLLRSHRVQRQLILAREFTRRRRERPPRRQSRISRTFRRARHAFLGRFIRQRS